MECAHDNIIFSCGLDHDVDGRRIWVKVEFCTDCRLELRRWTETENEIRLIE